MDCFCVSWFYHPLIDKYIVVADYELKYTLASLSAAYMRELSRGEASTLQTDLTQINDSVADNWGPINALPVSW